MSPEQALLELGMLDLADGDYKLSESGAALKRALGNGIRVAA